jgi:DNA-binding transcriptional ArsR family regulator
MTLKSTYGMEKARGVFCVVPQRAVHDTRLQHRPKTLLCLLALCNYANRTGVCYPNQNTIAKDLNITQSTVSRHIKLLKEYGYVRMASKKSKSGSVSKALSWRSNAYFIVFDDSVTEQDAIAVQTAKDWDDIHNQPVDKPPPKNDDMYSNRMLDIHSNTISNTNHNTYINPISKNIINEFKKMLETKFGQVIIWKGEDEAIVSQWLERHSKEWILNNIERSLDWRRSKDMDGIKRITYFHKRFMDDGGPKTKRDQFENLVGKFTNTHRVKW